MVVFIVRTSVSHIVTGVCTYIWLACILVGCKNRASEGVFYIGSHGCLLCQFIELVMFAHCAFIFELQNIALGGYLDTRRII